MEEPNDLMVSSLCAELRGKLNAKALLPNKKASKTTTVPD